MFLKIAKGLRFVIIIRETWSKVRRGRCGGGRGLLSEPSLETMKRVRTFQSTSSSCLDGASVNLTRRGLGWSGLFGVAISSMPILFYLSLPFSASPIKAIHYTVIARDQVGLEDVYNSNIFLVASQRPKHAKTWGSSLNVTVNLKCKYLAVVTNISTWLLKRESKMRKGELRQQETIFLVYECTVEGTVKAV